MTRRAPPPPGRNRLALCFAATAPDLAAAQRRLAEFLAGTRLPAPLPGRAELLLEDLVLNVIAHGGLRDLAAATLTLTVSADQAPPGMAPVFEDPAAPVDPTAGPLPPDARTLEAARPGGLGLRLLRHMAADLAHVRLPEGRNRVTLVLRG